MGKKRELSLCYKLEEASNESAGLQWDFLTPFSVFTTAAHSALKLFLMCFGSGHKDQDSKKSSKFDPLLFSKDYVIRQEGGLISLKIKLVLKPARSAVLMQAKQKENKGWYQAWWGATDSDT